MLRRATVKWHIRQLRDVPPALTANPLQVIDRKLQQFEARLKLVESELKGELDLGQFYVKPYEQGISSWSSQRIRRLTFAANGLAGPTNLFAWCRRPACTTLPPEFEYSGANGFADGTDAAGPVDLVNRKPVS